MFSQDIKDGFAALTKADQKRLIKNLKRVYSLSEDTKDRINKLIDDNPEDEEVIITLLTSFMVGVSHRKLGRDVTLEALDYLSHSVATNELHGRPE